MVRPKFYTTRRCSWDGAAQALTRRMKQAQRVVFSDAAEAVTRLLNALSPRFRWLREGQPGEASQVPALAARPGTRVARRRRRQFTINSSSEVSPPVPGRR